MLSKRSIRDLFRALNAELQSTGTIGEVGICGGAVMCLVFNARASTKDVDAIFRPTRQIREAAARVGRKLGAPADWLNDAAKGFFLGEIPSVEVMSLSNLRVWAPTPEYMLAMKCISARFDSHDADDVRFLTSHLGLKHPQDVFEVVEDFYPSNRIPRKTQYFIEEILQRRNSPRGQDHDASDRHDPETSESRRNGSHR
jgi:hypothetical protein